MKLKFWGLIVTALAPLTAPAAVELAVPLQNATATHSQEIGGFFVSRAIDGITSEDLGWSIYPNFVEQTAVFETTQEIGYEGGTKLSFAIASLHNSAVGGSHTLGRFRLSVTTDPRDSFADGAWQGGQVSANWTVLTPLSMSSDQGTTFTELDDHSILAGGPAPLKDTYRVTAATSLTGITGIRLEALEHSSLPHSGPGRVPESGNFVVSEFTVTMTPDQVAQFEIVSPLRDQIVDPGESASFSVTVTAADPVTYQWAHEGEIIPGAEGPTLSLESVNGEDAGDYTVTITSGMNVLTSTGALRIRATERPIALQNATATHSQEVGGFFVSKAIDGISDADLGWSIYPEFVAQTAVFETIEDVGFEGGTRLTFTIASLHRSVVEGSHTLGRFRLAVTTDPRNTFADGAWKQGAVSANWMVLRPDAITSTDGTGFTLLEDGSVLAEGPAPLADTYTITGETPVTGITGFRLEALEHPSLPHDGPGRMEENGNFVVSEFSATMSPSDTAELVILSSPTSQTVGLGETALFRVAAYGREPITYQWSKGGELIEGADTASLLLNHVDPEDAGDYTVTIVSGTNTVSRTASLTVRTSNLSVPLQNATATHSQEIGGFLVAKAMDGVTDDNSGWGIIPEIVSQTAVFETSTDIGFSEGTLLVFQIESLHTSGGGSHALGRFRISMTLDPRNLFADGLHSGGDTGANWVVLHPEALFSLGGAILTVIDDGSILASGPAAETDAYTVVATTPLTGITGIRLEALEHPSLPHDGPGRFSENGNFVVSEFTVTMTPQNHSPVILGQPQSGTVLQGGSTNLTVMAASSKPLSYQWYHNGAPLAEAASASLSLTDLQASDAGEYYVLVANEHGIATSETVMLSIYIPDTEPPVVTFTSPTDLTVTTNSVTIVGTASDDREVQTVRWERNGQVMGVLPLVEGRFTIPVLRLNPGENIIRAIAADPERNEGSASITITYLPPRALVIPVLDPVQEGGELVVPIELHSTGGIGGMTFQVGFRSDQLRNPTLDWEFENPGLLTEWSVTNFPTPSLPSRVRATFAMSGGTLPAGEVRVATLRFRTRSVPVPIWSDLQLQVLGAYTETGEAITSGTETVSGRVQITKRKHTGDNNANDLLDVGDASIILRFATQLEPMRQWDVPANDLNNNVQVDAGDAIRVLRAAAGIDPQPGEDLSAQNFQASSAQGIVTLFPDKTRVSNGEQIKLLVRLDNVSEAISGASFILDYPAEVLKLEDANAHRIGSLVPAQALVLWNVSPAQSDYTAQNGRITLAMSSATPWTENNGELAELTFTAQPGISTRYLWPITVRDVTISSESGYQISSLPPTTVELAGRAPNPARLGGQLTEEGFNITIEGEIGALNQVDVSEDLISWTPLSTIRNESGTITVNDPEATGKTRRFYRAIIIE